MLNRTILIMPNRKHHLTALLRDIAIIALLLGGGAYFIYIAIHGFVTDQASTIGKDSSWMSRADYPKFFWISIIFHGSAGSFAIISGLKMLVQKLVSRNKKKTN